MRAFRSRVVRTNEYAFYVLVALSAAHILGVLPMELARRSNVVSAMINGRKRLHGTSKDAA